MVEAGEGAILPGMPIAVERVPQRRELAERAPRAGFLTFRDDLHHGLAAEEVPTGGEQPIAAAAGDAQAERAGEQRGEEGSSSLSLHRDGRAGPSARSGVRLQARCR